MVKSRSQTAGSSDWTGGRLLAEIGSIQQGLIRHGITAGDRVAGYLPNIPQTLAAYLGHHGPRRHLVLGAAGNGPQVRRGQDRAAGTES